MPAISISVIGGFIIASHLFWGNCSFVNLLGTVVATFWVSLCFFFTGAAFILYYLFVPYF
jgi:hypothetical protein